MSARLFDQERPEACLSDLALERLLVEELGPGAERDAIARHLAACARCQARRDALAAAPAQEPDPTFWQRQSARPPPRRAALGAGLAGMAALAALVLVLRPRPAPRPDASDDARVKGGGAALELVARDRDGRTVPVFEGTSLRPGEAVRFIVTSPKPAHLAIVGLDAGGQVSLYWPPPAGASDEWPPGAHEVPGSIVLDATPGEERFVAVVCDAPIDHAALERAGHAALTAAAGLPSRTGSLPVACAQAGLTIRKGPP